jgi:hypothetical protein
MNVTVGNNYSIANQNTSKQTVSNSATKSNSAQQAANSSGLPTDVVEISAQAKELSAKQTSAQIVSDLDSFSRVVFSYNNGGTNTHADLLEALIRNELRNEDGSWTEKAYKQLYEMDKAIKMGKSPAEIGAIRDSFYNDPTMRDRTVGFEEALSSRHLQILSERLGMTEDQSAEMLSLVVREYFGLIRKSGATEITYEMSKEFHAKVLLSMQQLLEKFNESKQA